MLAHDYSIVGHDRARVGRVLGWVALIVAPILTGIIAASANLSFLTDSIRDKLVVFTISSGLVYTLLYAFFNRFVWKWIDEWLGVPNLGGKWKVSGQTLERDASVKYEWQGSLTITQQWDKISIALETSQSGSDSETASILVKPDKKAKLSYSYQNRPKAGQAELEKHQGFCELIFDTARNSGEGHYFNSMGRYTFGKMVVTREAY